ncbi:hypothetical protein PHMEG_00023170 [Phytophthora megakarya]|uniref:Uncharacterized protein n=1 Tax=Phytophthora megakarya TaxID=4795 RepID=A0A225VGZ6_9STRA|nr:hypothetical protein PHMEG_00023170 [Phytophthora megakarya]
MTSWLSPYSSGTGSVQCSSLHRPASHSKPLVASDIATYSASQVFSALISCLQDAYDSTLPSIMINRGNISTDTSSIHRVVSVIRIRVAADSHVLLHLHIHH